MLKGNVATTKSLLTLNRFEIVEKEAFISSSTGDRTRITRQGLSTGPAVSILPYVRNPDDSKWNVILVSEYRPMVDEVCLEAPGGLIEPDLGPEEQMTKILKDETNITIAQNLIRIAGIKWAANSFSDQKVWLGTIELDVGYFNRFKDNLCGRSNPKEMFEATEVKILPLSYLVENLDFEVSYDLTSYQILELARYLKLLRFSPD